LYCIDVQSFACKGRTKTKKSRSLATSVFIALLICRNNTDDYKLRGLGFNPRDKCVGCETCTLFPDPVIITPIQLPTH